MGVKIKDGAVLKSKVSDDILIERRSESREYAIISSASTGLRYVVDLGVYFSSEDVDVIVNLPAPTPETDSLTIRTAKYRDDDGVKSFIKVLDLGSNTRTSIEPLEYYDVATFGDGEPIETHHYEPDIHVVWIEETGFYDDKVTAKLGRCFAKGITDMAVVTHLASLQGSSWVEFVGNECEVRPDIADGEDFDDATEKFFQSAGFDDEFEFVNGGDSDYYDYGSIERRVKCGETVQLSGFDEYEVDTYRLHPDEETRNKAMREIMEAARHEASEMDMTGVPGLLAVSEMSAPSPAA